MAIAVKVRQGGEVGAPTTDFANAVQMIDSAYEFSVGMQFDSRGGASLSQFTIDDDPNTAYLPRAHNLITVTENASGTEYITHLGRVAATEGARGQVEYDVARILPVKSEDANVDVSNITLIEPWVRGVETGTVRVLALGAAFLNGNFRTTTDITVDRFTDGHLVKPHPTAGEAAMPANTYPPGTRLVEILADCAETEGQAYGVVLHDVIGVGTHPCLQYCEEDDWLVNPCSLSITDSSPNYTTSFPPIWDNGPAINREGQDVATGLVVKYGTGDDSYVVTEDTALIDVFDRWILPYNDSRAQTASAAANRAPHLLAGQNDEYLTHSLSIKLPASKVHLVRAGMSIDLQAAASRHTETLGTSVTRRVASVMLEPIQPEVGAVEGQYLVHLQLARPQKIARTRQGPLTPKPAEPSSSPGFARAASAGYSSEVQVDVLGSDDDPTMYVAVLTRDVQPIVSWHNAGYAVAGSVNENFSLMDKIVHATVPNATLSHDDVIWVFRLNNPTPAASAGVGEVRAASPGGEAATTGIFGVWIVNGGGTATVFTAQGNGSITSITPTAGAGDLVLDTAGRRIWNGGVSTPTAGSGQTEDWAAVSDMPSGQADSVMGGGHSTGAGARTWNIGTSTDWVAAAIVIAGAAGDTPEPVIDSGDPGDSDDYARSDHTHAHGDLSGSTSDYHHATSVEVTPFGTIAATNVQDALEEIVAEATGGGAHASTHEDGGADEIEIANLPTSATDTALVLKPDGLGGVVWGTDATGGGGGGAGTGNVVASPDGSTISIPGLAPADRVPSSPAAADEEFNQATSGVPSGWTALGSADIVNTADVASHLHLQAAAATGINFKGIYKAAPSIPFTVTTHVRAFRHPQVSASGYAYVMLLVGEATPGVLFGILIYRDTAGTRIGAYKATSPTGTLTGFGTDVTLSSGVSMLPPAELYMRLVVASSTNITAQFSTTGLPGTWITFAAAANPSFTVGSVALAVNSTNASHVGEAYFDWMRFES